MRLNYRWEWQIAVPPRSVWPFVSNTDRINRSVGLPMPTWEEIPLPEGGVRRIARTKVANVSVAWEEFPYEWRVDQQLSVFRRYLEGPMTSQRFAVFLDPAGSGGKATRIRLEVDLETARWWAVPIARSAALNFGKKFGELARRLEGQLTGGPEIAFVPSPIALGQDALARLAAASATLVGRRFAVTTVQALAELLRTGSDEDLVRLRPFALAEAWGAPRDEVLRLFLHATELGILDLSWDMVCPHCRGSRGHDSLSKLAQAGHCPSCNVDFEANFDRSIELTFRPNAAIRTIEAGVFCIGGPGNTPHVVAQSMLEPGAETSWSLGLGPGAYRVRGPQTPEFALLHVTPDSPEVGPVCLELTPSGIQPAELAVQGPDVSIQVANRSGRRQLVLLERVEWADNIVSAAHVTSIQEFRDLFASEALAPDVKIGVARLAFLFTDLKSSTEMYEEHGDAKAFSVVRDHFDLMEEAVAQSGGAIVKTIGDAIMAVFSEPAACVRAALRIQEAFAEFNRTADIKLVVKAGAHLGPCLAVNFNDRLDYFGTTVNIAARVQGLSEGDDLLLTRELVEDSAVDRLLAGLPCPRAVQEVSLKGLKGTFALTRLWPVATSQPLFT